MSDDLHLFIINRIPRGMYSAKKKEEKTKLLTRVYMIYPYNWSRAPRLLTHIFTETLTHYGTD